VPMKTSTIPAETGPTPVRATCTCLTTVPPEALSRLQAREGGTLSQVRRILII
jgi:hypothetical protein